MSRNWIKVSASKTVSPSIREMIDKEHIEKQPFCVDCLHFNRKTYGFGNNDFGKCYVREHAGEVQKLKGGCYLFTSGTTEKKGSTKLKLGGENDKNQKQVQW